MMSDMYVNSMICSYYSILTVLRNLGGLSMINNNCTPNQSDLLRIHPSFVGEKHRRFNEHRVSLPGRLMVMTPYYLLTGQKMTQGRSSSNSPSKSKRINRLNKLTNSDPVARLASPHSERPTPGEKRDKRDTTY
jgi:hypothetical protein